MEAAVAERLAPPAPAAGYRIRPFVPGDERHWARIETSVGEFSEEAAARAYFERVYLPEAALRCLFVVTERTNPSQRRRHGRKRRHRCVSYNSMGGRRTRPPRTGSGTCDRHGGGTTGRTTRPPAKRSCCIRRHGATGRCGSTAASDSASAARRRSSCGARRDGHEALPQRIRRGDGGIAPHGRPRRDRRMAPHGVPVIGRIGYSSGVSM